MRRQGNCHCGAVRIEVDFPSDAQPHRCNCSLCAMKGNVMYDVPLEALRIVTGADNLALYVFNTGAAKHRFCKICGIHVFHQLRSDQTKYGVNGVCFEGMGPFDFGEMPVHDGGGAHPKDTGRPMRIAGTIRYEPNEH